MSLVTVTVSPGGTIRADRSRTGETVYLVLDDVTVFLTGEQADQVVAELERVRDGETR